jgi:hypothetical protein
MEGVGCALYLSIVEVDSTTFVDSFGDRGGPSGVQKSEISMVKEMGNVVGMNMYLVIIIGGARLSMMMLAKEQ